MSRHTLRANPGSSARSAASRVASRKSQGRSARMPFHFQASHACASTASCWSSHRQRAATCGADATDSVSTRVALRAHRPPSPSATPGKAAHLCVLDGLLRERMRSAGIEDEESRLPLLQAAYPCWRKAGARVRPLASRQRRVASPSSLWPRPADRGGRLWRPDLPGAAPAKEY